MFLILFLSFPLPGTPLLADALAASGECSLDLERQSLERQSLERQSQLARTYRLFGDRPEPRHRPSS